MRDRWLSPSRVHQLVADAGLDAVIAAPGELQAAGWPTPKTPIAMRTLTWTPAITSSAACRTRRTGCDSTPAGSGSPARVATHRRSACARPLTGRTAPSSPSTSRGCGRPSTASPPTWTNSPAPGGPGTWPPQRCSRPTGGAPPAAGRARPEVPGLLRPHGIACRHQPCNCSGRFS